MLMDEAMNDLRAMYLLEDLTDRDTVLGCIEQTPDEEVTFKKYPRSISYLTDCRERINEAIRSAIQKKI